MSINIFCDFDGVINVFPYERTIYLSTQANLGFTEGHNYGIKNITIDPSLHYTLDQKATINNMPITYSSELIHILNTIMMDPTVNFRWLSTWKEELPRTVMPSMGLTGSTTVTDWHLLGMSDYMEQGKTRAIVQYYEQALANGTDLEPFIWLEDVAARPYATRENSVPDRSIFDFYGKDTDPRLLEIPHLIIAPNDCYGLTRNHTALIHEFINKHSSGER